MEINIRQETESDRHAVNSLVEEAFKTAEHSDGNEHILVAELRDCDAFIPELSLVATLGDEIVGHIMFTRLSIDNQAHLALAPLSVAPPWQRKGIGGALIKEGHLRARELGYGFSVVLGDNGYYGRFGYTPASKFGIKPLPGIEDKYYMAVELNPTEIPGSGIVRYASPFGI